MIDSDDQKILDYLNKIDDQKNLDYILNFSWLSFMALIIFLMISIIRTIF
jgi:hypothetical protein